MMESTTTISPPNASSRSNSTHRNSVVATIHRFGVASYGAHLGDVERVDEDGGDDGCAGGRHGALGEAIRARPPPQAAAAAAVAPGLAPRPSEGGGGGGGEGCRGGSS